MGESDGTCAICLDDMYSNENICFLYNSLTNTRCGHIFHCNCLEGVQDDRCPAGCGARFTEMPNINYWNHPSFQPGGDGGSAGGREPKKKIQSNESEVCNCCGCSGDHIGCSCCCCGCC